MSFFNRKKLILSFVYKISDFLPTEFGVTENRNAHIIRNISSKRGFIKPKTQKKKQIDI